MSLSIESIDKMRSSFVSDPQAKVAQNALAGNMITKLIPDADVINSVKHTMGVKLDKWEVTNQKASGRCWLFALLNLLRPTTMNKLNVKSFEFSQAHIHFWDKFERSNYFLESMMDLADRDADDRTVAYMLHDPIGDGGQWNMATNLVRKHGLVPKSVYPETFTSEKSIMLNGPLRKMLRTYAVELRRMINDKGASNDAVRRQKEEYMANIYRVLCLHLGTPPQSFEWEWVDNEDKLNRRGRITPKEFVQEYVTIEWDSMVCLVNDPRNEYYACYSVDRLDNMVGGEPVKYLNIPIQDMKDVARQHLDDGICVWMGCDVGKSFSRDKGIWHTQLVEPGHFYGIAPFMNQMTKAERLKHGDSMMTHAMLFTGVDVVDGEIKKWRVENSWGSEGGIKGFYTMDDGWFDEHMFEISSLPKYLTAEMVEALKKEPIVLPAWDPMGSLANEEALQYQLQHGFDL